MAAERALDAVLERVRPASQFLPRTATPPLPAVSGRRVVDPRRLGERILLAVEADVSLGPIAPRRASCASTLTNA